MYILIEKKCKLNKSSIIILGDDIIMHDWYKNDQSKKMLKVIKWSQLFWAITIIFQFDGCIKYRNKDNKEKTLHNTEATVITEVKENWLV